MIVPPLVTPYIIYYRFPYLISYFKDKTLGSNSRGLPLAYGMRMKVAIGIVLLRLVRSAIPALDRGPGSPLLGINF